jgi:hypothetical protein
MAEAVERSRALMLRAQEALRKTDCRLEHTHRLLQDRVDFLCSDLPLDEREPTAPSECHYRVVRPFCLRGACHRDLIPGDLLAGHLLPHPALLNSLLEAGILRIEPPVGP